MQSSEPMTDSGLPTSSLSRSTRLAFGERPPSLEGTSPIAADGGFGPMSYDEDDDGSEKDTIQVEHTTMHGEEPDFNEGFGDEFDDFEAGAGDDDFGDFDEGFQQPSEPQVEPKDVEQPRPPAPTPESPFVSSYTLIDLRLLYMMYLIMNERQLIGLFRVAPHQLLLPLRLR